LALPLVRDCVVPAITGYGLGVEGDMESQDRDRSAGIGNGCRAHSCADRSDRRPGQFAFEIMGRIWHDHGARAAYGGVWLHGLDVERNKKPQLKSLRPSSKVCPR
jgi:hypothetical protein